MTDDSGPAAFDSAAARPIPGLNSIVFAALTVSLAGFLFGYDTGVQAGVQGLVQQYFHLGNFWIGFTIASLDIGCVAGAASGGVLADRFGRKRVLVLCAVLFAVSGIASAVPRDLWQLIAARVLGGLALGASSMVAPVYISEIAPERHRGRLAALFQLGIVIGIFLVYWVNYGIAEHGLGAAAGEAAAGWNLKWGWRWMLGTEALPALAFLLLLIPVKESPRWLIVNGREREAKGILDRFLGPQRADEEIAALTAVAAEEEGRFTELFSRRYRLPLVVALFLAVFSQFSGINSIIYYAPRLFGAAGMKTGSAFGSTALVGTVNLLFTFVAIGYVDKAGRKLLLAIGTAIQVAALATVGLIFALAGNALAFTPVEIDLLIASVLVFIAAFAMAMGPIPWIVISEIFPSRIRGRAASVGILTLWIAIFLVSLTFPWLMVHIGLTATYFIYAACSLISFLFVVLVLPETKGRTLEEIERSWGHHSGGT
jgi:SP family arabinose:H+ symporter-like MFS transporter